MNLLIKPASGACNMRCSYCFYADEMAHRECANFGMMSVETLEKIVEKSLANADRFCNFMFQGGEPTLVGIDFYRALPELVKKHNTRGVGVGYAIQTNGYNIDDEWARLFAREKYLVGLSLDGPREIHDANRKNAAGRGTFDAVTKTAALFDKHKVEYNILSVVTGASARGALKIHNYFDAKGFGYQQYIPCLDPLDAPGSTPMALKADQYAAFLCRTFDAWYDDLCRGKYVYNRTFENWMAAMIGRAPENCGMAGVCSPQYVVEADGGVYPCDFFVMDEYKLGNFLTDSFEQMDAKRAELGFIERSRRLHPDCMQCRYYTLCRGGCYRDRVELGDGEPPKNRFCAAYLKFFPYAVDRMADAVRRLLNN
ncbi:MAG: anaerobic sulfatase maturase [Clostridia bacterium]|nr:anaerobic sulfatase maturase [Clostridia bacterium]